jgi:hypothetical protein
MLTDPPDLSAAMKALKEELQQLVEQQQKLIKTAVFGGMTPEEQKQYDDRQARVTKLIERLTALEKAETD